MGPSDKNPNMKKQVLAASITPTFRDRAAGIIRENKKLLIQFILTALFIYMAFWFISHERGEIMSVRGIISSAKVTWIIAGLALVILYIILRGLMYVTSFASIGKKVSLGDSVLLFLKRNFISVFLPAGGVSSLVFFISDVEKKGVTKSQIFFASSINAFVGILTVVIVAIPAFLFVVSGEGAGRWLALGATVVLLLIFLYAFYSLKNKKGLYKLIIRIFPGSTIIMEDMSNHRIKAIPFLYTVIVSIIVELLGIAHVYIAMAALGARAELSSAIMAYIIVIIFLVISPFLRGLGAIEVSMSYVLIQFGFGKAESIAITMLFRFFEFWLPLLAGLASFLHKTEKLLLRIFPAVLIFALALVNIISVLTPALPERMKLLRDFLFMDVISFSNIFVLVSGLLLLLTAVFMLRGLRSAWWFALILSFISMIGHLTKGIDYEEATVALIVLGSLLATRKEYYVRVNRKLGSLGIQTAVLSIAAVLLFGIIGFYFLDKKHFRIDFNITQSIKYTIQNFLLFGSGNLVPADQFARDFVNLIKLSGFATISFLVYSLARPYIFKAVPTEEEKARAASLTAQFGKSSLDYFKTYYDKLIYAPEGINAFISYKVSSNFAVVLEDPVAEDTEAMKSCILSFSRFCYDNGLKDIYYRVPAESLPVYNELSRKSLFIGQEAIVDLNEFTLAGGEMKPVRNALNKIKAEGYITRVNTPPLRDGLIQKLKAVSKEWLESTGREEIVFSQGVFDEKEIKGQTVITVENSEEMVIGFMNIIPDNQKDEGTYDLQRKSVKAPNGIMDHLLIELFNYFKASGIRYVNLGFAPMSGVNDPHNFPERSMKFAYEKIRSFAAYKGLREYKEKFKPSWNDKYLIYSNDYDLVQIPGALAKVIKP
jgi:phosphatidylglycerol lysyltransferase